MTKARDLAGIISGQTDVPQDSLGNVPPVTPTQVSDKPNTSTGYFALPQGNDSDRPLTAMHGMLRFNADSGLTENYNGAGWQGIDAPPSIISQSGVINTDTDSTIVINGSNFKPGSLIYIEGSAVNNIARGIPTTYLSSSQLTGNTNASSQNFVGGQSYDVKVVNPSGLGAILSPAGNIDRDPLWSTPSGSLGTYAHNEVVNQTLVATDPDGDTITYSLESGSFPSGITFNNGVISGTPSGITSSVTYPITVRATANGQSVDRTFSIGFDYRPFQGVRYVRFGANGNTQNGSTHWVELQVYTGQNYTGSNIASTASRSATGSAEGGSANTFTDGSTDTNNYYGYGGASTQTLDFGSVRYDIGSIRCYMYYGDGRSYYGTYIQTSTDGSNWTTRLSSATRGTPWGANVPAY
jgi:hypothetical protein